MAFFIFLMMLGYRLNYEVPDDNIIVRVISWVVYIIGFFGVTWLYDKLK